MKNKKKEEKKEESKKKKLENLMKELNKKYETCVMKHPSEAPSYKKSHHPTGSLGLDLGLGYSKDNNQWGWPGFSVCELIGEKGTAKTCFCLRAAKYWVEKGGLVCYIDAEHALEEVKLKAFGVYDNDQFVIVNPESGTNTWDLFHDNMKSGIYDLIVLDSLATIQSRAEEKAESAEDEKQQAGSAKLNNEAVRQIHANYCMLANKYDDGKDVTLPMIMIVNQSRQTLSPYSPSTSPGGEGRKCLDMVTVKLSELPGKDNILSRDIITVDKEGKKFKLPDRLTKVADMREVYGVTVKFDITKNKVGPPHRHGRFVFLVNDFLGHKFGDIYTELEIFLAFLKEGIIRPGAKGWYAYKDKNYRENELLLAFSKNLDYYMDMVYTLYGKEEVPEDIFEGVDFDEIKKEVDKIVEFRKSGAMVAGQKRYETCEDFLFDEEEKEVEEDNSN